MWTHFASPLLSLPLELIDRILCNLDLSSLLKCKQACKKLKERIEHGKSIQYIMELEISGLEMNPNNDWSAAASFQCLRQHQSAWEKLEGSNESKNPIVIPMANGHLWELYAGVIAQTDLDGRFHFTKLPSTFRHIQQETWDIVPDIPRVRDFCMDPGQDLLVWIAVPTPASPVLSLHLRTLGKAEKHPLSRHEVIRYDQSTTDTPWYYSVKIMQDYIGLSGSNPTDDETNTSFLIWNWKEGTLELDISTPYTQSFSFISDRYVVLADKYDGPFHEDGEDETEVYLTLIDFKAEGSTQKPLEEVRNAIKLCYPTRADGTVYLSFNISSDPAPGWSPGMEDKTPFFVAKENRVFTVSIQAIKGHRDLAFYHFIPLSAFQKCLDRLDTSLGQEMQWSEWAPRSTRMLRSNAPASTVWVCYAFGSRSITSVVTRLTGEGNQTTHYLTAHVYDFNQLALHSKDSDPVGNCKRVVQTEVLEGPNSIWKEIVETSLPYRRFTRILPVRAWPANQSLMCTADHIVLVDTENREYLIFAF